MRAPAAVRAAGWLLAVAGLAGIGVVYRAEMRQEIPFRLAFLANIGTVSIIAFGIFVATRRVAPASQRASRRAEIVAVAAVTLFGALMRTLYWDVFPPADGQLLEEPQVAWNAVRSIRFGHIDAYFPITNLIGEIGFRIIGPTMNGLRIPFVVLGILSVPVFYVTARLFLGTPVSALFVTLLFAGNSMLAGSSRIALETMHPIFTLVVGLAFVFFAAAEPTVGKCALAGVFNGLLLAEYDSYRLTPLLNLIFLAVSLRPRREEASWPGAAVRWRRWLAYLFVYSVFVLGVETPRILADPHNPLVQLTEASQRHQAYLVKHREGMTLHEVAAEEWAKFRTNVGHIFLHGDSSDVLPGNMGHFDPYTGVLGVAALTFCLVGAWWNPVRAFPLIAVVLILVLSTVLVGNIARYRLMPLIPYYLLAIGLLVAAIERGFTRARRVVAALLFVVALGLTWINVYRFFGVAIRDRHVQEMFYDLSMVLSREIAQLQRRHPEARVVVLTDQTHLAKPNDYAFWYDYEKVEVFPSAAHVRGRTGYLLAHDRFIPNPDELPGMKECAQWKTKFDRNLIMRCRLEPEVTSAPVVGNSLPSEQAQEGAP